MSAAKLGKFSRQSTIGSRKDFGARDLQQAKALLDELH
jgi:hypothetical protein